MSKRLLVADKAASGKERPPSRPDADAAWRIATGLGSALFLVGWIDVVLIWLPPNFASPEWEFATVSATYNALPLATLGGGVLAAAAGARGARRLLRSLSLVFAVVVAALLTAYAIFMLDSVMAWNAVQDAVRPTLRLAIFKTTAYALIYLVLYGWLSGFTWRRSRHPR